MAVTRSNDSPASALIRESQSDTSETILDPFAAVLAEELKASEDKLDMATLSQLNQARQQALEQAKASSTFSFTGWMGVAGGALASLIVVTLFMASPAMFDSSLLEEQDLGIALESNWELYDDLEFYEWLAEVEHG